MKILQFTSHSCGPCVFLKKARTIPLFVEAQQAKGEELEGHIIEIDDKDGYTGTKAEVEAYKLSDVYDVQSLPGLIFVTDTGLVLGQLTRTANVITLEKAFKKAKNAEEKLSKKLGASDIETAFATYMKSYGSKTRM